MEKPAPQLIEENDACAITHMLAEVVDIKKSYN